MIVLLIHFLKLVACRRARPFLCSRPFRITARTERVEAKDTNAHIVLYSATASEPVQLHRLPSANQSVLCNRLDAGTLHLRACMPVCSYNLDQNPPTFVFDGHKRCQRDPKCEALDNQVKGRDFNQTNNPCSIRQTGSPKINHLSIRILHL